MAATVSNANNLNQVIIEGKVTHSVGGMLALKVRNDLTIHFACDIEDYESREKFYGSLIGKEGIKVEGSLERKNAYKKSIYWIEARKISNKENKVFFEVESK